MAKKKKNVVRCVVCGLRATTSVSVEPVCQNIVCHETVRDYIRTAVADEKNKESEQ